MHDAAGAFDAYLVYGSNDVAVFSTPARTGAPLLTLKFAAAPESARPLPRTFKRAARRHVTAEPRGQGCRQIRRPGIFNRQARGGKNRIGTLLCRHDTGQRSRTIGRNLRTGIGHSRL